MYAVYFGVAIETGIYVFDRRRAMRVLLMRTPPHRTLGGRCPKILNGNLDGKSFAGINLQRRERRRIHWSNLEHPGKQAAAKAHRRKFQKTSNPAGPSSTGAVPM